MSRRGNRSYPIKGRGGEVDFRSRKSEQPRARQVTRRVVSDYRSSLSKLSRGTLKNVNDDDSKSLRLLVMKFKFDLSSARIYPATESSPDSVLLMLDNNVETRVRTNLRKAVEWRSWDNPPKTYVVHKTSRGAIPLTSPKAPTSKDVGGVLLQWGDKKEIT